MTRRALVLAVLACAPGAGCRRAPEQFGSHALFVPVAFRANNPGRPHWETRTSLTNTSSVPSTIRLTRWPPESAEAETRNFSLSPGQRVSVPARIPLGAPSSFFFEGNAPFAVTASVVDRRGLAPTLLVPVLPAEALARPGDRLLTGPIVDTPEERSHFAFTYPGVERDAVPFRIRLRLTRAGTGELLWDGVFVLTGLPIAMDDPWTRFHLAPGTAFDVEVTFLGSARARPVARGMWVYGITTTRATSASRFLETRVVRGSAR